MAKRSLIGKALTGFSQALRPIAISKMQQQADRAKMERMAQIRKGEIFEEREYQKEHTAQQQAYRTSEREASEQATAEEKQKDRLLKKEMMRTKPTKEPKVQTATIEVDGEKRLAQYYPETDTWKEIDAEGLGPSQIILSMADKFADEKVERMDKLFTGEKSEFKDFGGSKEKAREHFRQQYIKEASGDTSQTETKSQESFPDPAANKGRIGTMNGKRYKSDGTKWIEI
jgi:hypothetical protein